MNEGKTYRMYTYEDIRRYLNGEMSSMEMYALEKQAVEDPFLADAIDGYNAVVGTAAQSDLDVLRNTLEQKQEAKVINLNPTTIAKKTFPWTKMAIAASVVGIVLYFGIKSFNTPSQADEVAAKSATPAAPTSAAAPLIDTTSGLNKQRQPERIITLDSLKGGTYKAALLSRASVFVKPDDLDKFYGMEAGENPQQKLDAVVVEKSNPNREREVKRIDTVRADKDALEDAAVFGTKENEELAKAPTVQNKPANPVAKPIFKKEAAPELDKYAIGRSNDSTTQQVVSANNNDRRSGKENSNAAVLNSVTQGNNTNYNGAVSYDLVTSTSTAVSQRRGVEIPITRNYRYNYTVVDPQGNHIPFSNISVPADQLITYSRVDGRFGLFSADSVLKVNIKANGFQPQVLHLRSNEYYNNIVLTPAAPVADDKTTMVGNAKDYYKVKAKSAKLISQVEEVEPIDGLDNYDSYLANNINIAEKPQGEVVLSFEINKNGEATNIKVTQSLSQTADQEAVRLLAEGPKWKAKKRKKTKGKIVIKF
jgi:Gram-negative bacterial TonB protein C-terminal